MREQKSIHHLKPMSFAQRLEATAERAVRKKWGRRAEKKFVAQYRPKIEKLPESMKVAFYLSRREALSALVTALDDPDPLFRRDAAMALHELTVRRSGWCQDESLHAARALFKAGDVRGLEAPAPPALRPRLPRA